MTVTHQEDLRAPTSTFPSALRTVRLTARIQEASRPGLVDAAWLRGRFAHDIVVDVLDFEAIDAVVHATVVCDLGRVPQSEILLQHPEAAALWHKTIEAQFMGGWCDVVGDR